MSELVRSEVEAALEKLGFWRAYWCARHKQVADAQIHNTCVLTETAPALWYGPSEISDEDAAAAWLSTPTEPTDEPDYEAAAIRYFEGDAIRPKPPYWSEETPE